MTRNVLITALLLVANALCAAVPDVALPVSREETILLNGRRFLPHKEGREFVVKNGKSAERVDQAMSRIPAGNRLAAGERSVRQLQKLKKQIAEKQAEPSHIILQLEDIPTRAQKLQLKTAGIHLIEYLPGKAWLALVEKNKADQILQRKEIRWGDVLQVADKVELRIREKVVPSWARKAVKVELILSVFKGSSMAGVRTSLKNMGVQVLLSNETMQSLTVLCPENTIDAIAALDAVRRVALRPPPPAAHNSEVRAQVAVDPLQESPNNLSGGSVNVGIWDEGLIAPHADFGMRLVAVDTTNGVSAHSSHVAGTVGGSGLMSASQGGTNLQWRGLAPGATLLSFDWDFAGDDPTAEYQNAITAYDLDLSQNSWGIDMELAGSSYYGVYLSHCEFFDRFVRGELGRRIPICFSMGNDRDSTTAPPLGPGDYQCVAPPATAKNIISVGATDADPTAMAPFSNVGPTADGRLKPEIVAPGVGVKSTVPGDAYQELSGTSMAVPVVSGVLALLMERAGNEFSGLRLLPSTYKALICQSAQDIQQPGPDYQSGFGLVQAEGADALLRSHRFLEADLSDQAEEDAFKVTVGAGAPELKVTLAWDDYAGEALINDLDLELIEPAGTVHLPWVLDPGNPSSNAVTGIDSVNNIEQVSVANPVAGEWTVKVKGTTLPYEQSYSLVSGLVLSQSFPAPAVPVFPLNGASDAPVPATLRWRSGGGDPSGYKLYLGTANPPPLMADMQTNTAYAANALAYSTTYYWQVVPYNATGDATNCPVWSFTTLADPVVYSFPWTVDFGSEYYLPFPFQNWSSHSGALSETTVLGVPGDVAWYRTSWLNVGFSSNKAALIDLRHNYNGWLITPWLNIPAEHYLLSFDVALVKYPSLPPDPAGYDDVFAVLSSDDGTWGTSKILCQWDNAGSEYVLNNFGNRATRVTVPLGPAGIKRLAFYAGSKYSNAENQLFIDNIEVRENPGLPVMNVNPIRLDFGMGLQSNDTQILELTIENSGLGTLNLSTNEISVTGADAGDFYVDASVLPFALTNAQAARLPVYFNPGSEGSKAAALTVANSLFGQTNSIPLSGEALTYPSVAVGDGSEPAVHLPINPNAGFSYSQTILLQSEINQPGAQIEKLWFYWNSVYEGDRSHEWCIYMGHTVKTAFDNGDDWIPGENLTKVFEGWVALPAEPGWICITLDTPFIYNNSDNLVIATEENESLYLGFTTGFRGTAAGSARSIAYARSDHNPGPKNLYTGTLYNLIPNTMLSFGAAATDPVLQLSVSEVDFYAQEAGVTNGPLKLVTVRNVGGGTLNFDSSQMTLTGTDADPFEFYGDGAIGLLNGQFATFLLRFVPQTDGSKGADLAVPSNADTVTLPLRGRAFPPGSFYEDFEGGDFPPVGWTRSDDHWFPSCAGPELVMKGTYSALCAQERGDPESSLTMPPIRLEGESKVLSYLLKGFNNNMWYGASTLTLYYSYNGGAWQQLGAAVWFYYDETERFVWHDLGWFADGVYQFRFSVVSDFRWDDSGAYESAAILDEVRCSGSLEPPALEINPTNATLGSSAGSVPLELTAWGAAWTAACSDSWLHVSVTSGTANATLTLSADANTGLSSRIATVTFSNGVTPDRACTVMQTGARGNALAFDGTDDYVVMQHPAGTVSNAFSISAWVKWQPASPNEIDFICANEYEQMEIHTAGNTANNLRFIPATGVYLDAGPVLPTNAWTHIVCAYSADPAAAHVWVNGIEQSLANNGYNPLGTPLAATPDSFYLGRRADGSFYFKGCLDEFSIWNTVLSTAQVQTLMEAPPDLDSVGLLQVYSFNHGIPGADNPGITNLVDVKSGMDGTLYNFALSGGSSNWVKSEALIPVPASGFLLRITHAEGLHWDPVPGSDFYRVYRATAPDGEFVPVTGTGTNFWPLDFFAFDRAFFKVEALY